jgi:hypothetical protein
MRVQPPFLVVILIACGFLLTAVGQQPQSVVLQPGTASSSNPNVPQVHVSADKQRVPLGTLVNFTLSPATLANDRRYVVTLHFGDGQRQVMRKAETTHLYQSVGNYTYSVAVTQSQNNNSNDKVPSVGFTASPTNARAGEFVKFTALPSGPYPNLQYRFVYGDGSASGWQSAANSEHLYQTTGSYFAYVDIGDGKQRLGGSARKQIAISSSRPLTVSLTATQPARAGRPVAFNARVFPTSANAKYQFNFGDGQQTLWQVNSLAQHVYKTGGSYNAYVQVSQSGNLGNATVKSNLAVVSVQPISGPSPNPSTQPTPDTSASPTPTPESSPSPAESPSPNSSPSVVGTSTSGSDGAATTSSSTSSTDAANQNNGGVTSIRWWYWLLAGVLLLLLFKATGYLFVAKPTFTAFSDPGVAAIGNQKGLLPLDFQLLLNPNVSAGDYSVTSETPLVTNSEKLENRQVLEI